MSQVRKYWNIFTLLGLFLSVFLRRCFVLFYSFIYLFFFFFLHFFYFKMWLLFILFTFVFSQIIYAIISSPRQCIALWCGSFLISWCEWSGYQTTKYGDTKSRTIGNYLNYFTDFIHGFSIIYDYLRIFNILNYFTDFNYLRISIKYISHINCKS